MHKERLELPNDAEFLDYVERTKPLWRMGKRKKPPKLPQRAVGGMRMMYARVTTMQPDEVDAAIGTADVIIINWGMRPPPEPSLPDSPAATASLATLAQPRDRCSPRAATSARAGLSPPLPSHVS